MTQRILVTGASGFIGAPLVAALADAGYSVRALTRDPDRFLAASGVEVVGVSDFCEPVNWAPLLEGVDAVVHLAGIAHTGLPLADSVYDRVIYATTAELAEACDQAGVGRFIFLSSVKAQAGSNADHPLREDDPPHADDAYGRAKLKAEGAVRASAAAWTILRPVVVYGAGVKGNLQVLARLADSPWPLPFASFTNERSVVSRDNVLSAIAFALREPKTVRQTYLVADPRPVSLAELVTCLRQGLGRPSRLIPLPMGAVRLGLGVTGRSELWDRLGGRLVADPAKLIDAGWQPDNDTKAGLARMAKAARG